MKLRYQDDTAEVQEVINKIKSLSLAFTKNEDPEVEEVALEVDNDVFTGVDEILEYLDMIAGELDQWHYCHC